MTYVTSPSHLLPPQEVRAEMAKELIESFNLSEEKENIYSRTLMMLMAQTKVAGHDMEQDFQLLLEALQNYQSLGENLRKTIQE